MIRTKTQLIKHLKKLGEQKIEQGISFKELALSIEHHQKDKTLIEWLEFITKVLHLDNTGERRLSK